ncbi:hypothetical protein EAO71_36165 [Streptomyces sp. ms191]|nr:hypothetical protein EAO71_36165 [Streptomyces sp. ms191]
MPELTLIDADFDAWEAAQLSSRRLDEAAAEADLVFRDQLQTRYEIALDAGDRAGIKAALQVAADYDARHPLGARLVDELTGNQLAAA